jgi:hypothetical protein
MVRRVVIVAVVSWRSIACVEQSGFRISDLCDREEIEEMKATSRVSTYFELVRLQVGIAYDHDLTLDSSMTPHPSRSTSTLFKTSITLSQVKPPR